MYDSGGRLLFKAPFTSMASCALQCWASFQCKGVVVVDNSTCYGVNDTTHTTLTRLTSQSYSVSKIPDCTPDCGKGDALSYMTDPRTGRPVAAVGGLAQCQQFCDNDAAAGRGCEGIVHDPVGATCWTVNSTTSVAFFGNAQSYARSAQDSTRGSPWDSPPAVQWFVATDTAHVFGNAEPSQTAFCGNGTPRASIDWAAAPGQYVSAQIAVRTQSTDALQLDFFAADLVRATPTKDLLNISGTQIELAQIGDVFSLPSPAYVSELNTAENYPDILQPILSEAGYELAATGGNGSELGYRFAYDTGGRLISSFNTTTLALCQTACDQEDTCRGVVYNAPLCILTNDSALVVPTSLSTQSFRRLRKGMMLSSESSTRSIWVGLTLPSNLPPGHYTGSVSVTVSTIDTYTHLETFQIPIAVTAWPIESECIQNELRKFGSAYGFDHSVVPLLYPAIPSMADTFRNFTGVRHISSSSLTGWHNVDGQPELMDPAIIADLLTHQNLFPAATLGITPNSPNASAINSTWVQSKLDPLEGRIANLSAWGVLNRTYIYAFDEAGPEYASAVRLLFGEIKRRWPEVRTLAVLNWDASALVEVVDILVFQYQELQETAMSAARDHFVQAGKSVWGYHCISPSPSIFLNTFVDVALMKARLIPWLAAAEEFDGWLFWYTNWGSRHAPSAMDPAAQRLSPLRRLNIRNGQSQYDPQVVNGAHFTNEDGNWLYAGERGPLSSVRLEQYRRGLEDRALLALLSRSDRLALAQRMVRTSTNYTFDADLLEATRREAAALIGELKC